MHKHLTLILTAAACALLIGCSSSNEPKKAEEKQAPPAAAAPEAARPPETPAPAPVETAKPAEPAKAEPAKAEPAKPEPKKAAESSLPDHAPSVYKVRMDTSKGVVIMECHKAWSPKGADHFYDLVKLHFYDDARFFRVIRGFMAQFGMNGTPATNAVWANANILDDPPAGQHNTRGMVTYGKTGAPNSRSTQLFINFGDNHFLDAQGFTPVCQVTTGMEAVDQFWAGYGETPDQGMIGTKGNAYLNEQFPHLDYIKKATIVLQ